MEFNNRTIPPLSPPPAIGGYSDRPLLGEFINTVSMPLNNAVAGDAMRELEKAQIRREMIASGVARRIQLEAEVRRELALEALLGILPMQRNLSDERVAMSLNQPFNGRFAPPKSQQLPQLMAPLKIEPCPEETSKKDKVIILDKPNPDSRKRKAVIPSLDEHRKPKEEFSCALCQVSAPNQGIFNAHLQGKKHKAKEASLRKQNNAKRVKVESKNEEQPGKNEQNIEPLKNENGTTTTIGDEAERRIALKKIRAKFWCETCQVGAWAEAVMEDHLKGKRHYLNQLKKLDENN
ncbi:hypothetical protein PIB30_030135 [Stylosanthes scabra]|uniref:U1-type domain-containing protein n=1 Tax=Stylosanthes scabra TaxID=79078 RepID=A0ABU6ZCB2_9FABA|nr:hypothetical protein [Stylosanthes scabra]